MSETQRLLKLLDEAIVAARNAAYAHPIKVSELIALRALLVALAQGK